MQLKEIKEGINAESQHFGVPFVSTADVTSSIVWLMRCKAYALPLPTEGGEKSSAPSAMLLAPSKSHENHCHSGSHDGRPVLESCRLHHVAHALQGLHAACSHRGR